MEDFRNYRKWRSDREFHWMTFYISTKFKVYLVRIKSGSMKIDEEKIGGGIAFFFYLTYMGNRVKKKKKWVPRCFPPMHPKFFSLKWGDN